MSTPDVRYHLGVLVTDGRAEIISTRGREGKGRPEKLYAVPRAALGDNLAGLADALLAEAGTKVKMEAVAKRFVTGTEIPGQPMTKKLALVVERLNEMNYQARWEAGGEGPRIILGLCPYSAIIERHPELCKMDAAMLSALLERDVEQRARLSPFCVFTMK
jgi:predicted ArsR family transcriptional regulator